MYFLYVDESGKSGLNDLRQPYHVLGGLAVHETNWLAMERDLNARIDALVPPPRPHDWEIHMTDLQNGKGCCKGLPRSTREALRDAVLDVIDAYCPTLLFTVVDKQRHLQKYGANAISAEDYTYRLMIERFNYFLGRRSEVGMIVSDDQKGAEDSIRKAHSRYRSSGTGFTVIDNVIETPFFAPSHWSRMLQIIDVATWLIARSLRNQARGRPSPPEVMRLERHVDGYPQYKGYGLKVVP